MDELLADTISELLDKKRESGIGPDHITLNEIVQELKKSLNRLVKAKVITVGETMNDKWIKMV